MTPERAMEHARSLIASGQKVAVLFGPERSGLENEDIAHANALISVPVNPEFASLNLAQCVLLTAYEWRRQTAEILPETVDMAKTDWAEHIEVEKLAEHYEDQLDKAGFFYPEAKAAGMKITVRAMWNRLPLTHVDVQILHGMLRQMVRWKDRKDEDQSD
jgi:tRNA/rRNA methyltransferase